MIIKKVNTIFSKIKFMHSVGKCFSSNTVNQKFLLHPINTRGLVQLKGSDVTTFLQGIVTNDMRHFAEGKEAIYAMMLNNKGRVMFDTIIHKWDSEDNFILECDRKVLSSFQKHLKMFKLRKDIDIKDVSEEIKLWVLTSTAKNCLPQDLSMKDSKLHKDPRLSSLGYRILTPYNFTGQKITKELNIQAEAVDSEDHYRYFLYQLGVSEGVDNLPPNSCFPLEANCDFLHGVSFHKGCYIGQELTARVYHTGVVRKRIMPIKFDDPNPELQLDTNINSSKKQNIGKLKGLQKNVGLALVRIADALDTELNVGKYKAIVIRPAWWPLEAPKEKITNKDTVENIDVKFD